MFLSYIRSYPVAFHNTNSILYKHISVHMYRCNMQMSLAEVALSSQSEILISSTAGGLGHPIRFHIFFILAFF